MRLFKQSLLLTATLFLIVHKAWSMVGTEEDNSTEHGKPLLNVQLVLKKQDRQYALQRSQQILEDDSVLQSSGRDFSHQEIIQGFGYLPLIALPHLPVEWIYVKGRGGKVIPKRISSYSHPAFEIKVFGPGVNGPVNYRTEPMGPGAYQIESFSSPQVNTSPEERKKMRSKMGVVYPTVKNRRSLTDKNTPWSGVDRCHWNELQFIIPQPHDSNTDPKGYFPGCEELNQHIQGPIASSVKGRPRGGIGLIGFYDNTSSTIQQRMRLGYRNLTGFQPVAVPTGLIIKQIFSDEEGNIYYFPHDVGPSPQNLWPLHNCLYKRLLNEKGGHHATVELFKIQNAWRLFQPLIVDFELPAKQAQLNVYQTSFLGFNLLPQRELLKGFSLLSDLGIPVAISFTLGYTSEEIEEIVHLMHSNKPIPTGLAPRFPYWNNYQFPVSDERQWVNNADLIPLLPASLEGVHRAQFLRYTGLRKMEEAAKAQFDSVRLKLALVELYYLEGDYRKAKEWFLLACSQCEQLNSFSEAFLLFKRYLLYRKDITDPSHKQRELDYLINLINKTLPIASLEEVLQLEEFNEEMNGEIPPIPTGLEKVREISAKNSNILKRKFISSERVKTLTNLLQRTKSLEKIDLRDAVFVVGQEECVRTFPIVGQDEWDAEKGEWVHISDEVDWIDEPISEEEYFWSEEKPLAQLLTALQNNHGSSLKVLNLTGITFNGISEGAEVLAALRNLKMDALEDLYLTNNLIDGSNSKLQEALTNLPIGFPHLQNIFLGGDVGNKYTVDDLPLLAKVLNRPFLRKERQRYKIQGLF